MKDVLEGNRYFNRPILAQGYHVIDEAGTEGITMIELEQKLGVNKVISRQIIKYLVKTERVLCVPPEHARKRYYR